MWCRPLMILNDTHNLDLWGHRQERLRCSTLNDASYLWHLAGPYKHAECLVIFRQTTIKYTLYGTSRKFKNGTTHPWLNDNDMSSWVFCKHPIIQVVNLPPSTLQVCNSLDLTKCISKVLIQHLHTSSEMVYQYIYLPIWIVWIQ